MATVQLTLARDRRIAWIAGLTVTALVAVVVLGLWVFNIGPFALTVNDLVSKSIGTPAKCTTLGFAEMAGERTKVYSCAVRINGGDAVVCRAVIDGDVFTVSDDEYAGCGGA